MVNHGYFIYEKRTHYVGEIQTVVNNYLLNLNNEELKAVKKEDYETIMKFLTKLSESVSTITLPIICY